MSGKKEKLTEKLRGLRDTLATGLVERDDAVRLALLAAIAGEHLLMIGPPGTAKSLVARRLSEAFADAQYFERLLTRFTVPEELFGPFSIKGLEEDRFERKTEKFLPTASIAFLDEIFKANSAILNSTLTLLNERAFDNGTRREKVPLVAVIGASNELPEGAELDALYDRFLLRLHVGPVTTPGFRTLMTTSTTVDNFEVPPKQKLIDAELEALRTAAASVEVPTDVVALLCDLREWCAAEEIAVSDRRWRKVLGLLRMSAASCGRDAVSVWDCWLLQHCLWEQPDQRGAIYEWYAERVGTSSAMDPTRVTRIVASQERILHADQTAKTQARNDDGDLLYRDSAGEATSETRGEVRQYRGDEPLFLAPARAKDSHGRPAQRAHQRPFTEAELDNLRIDVPSYYSSVGFREWEDRQEYLENPVNWAMEDGDLIPINEPARYIEAHVQARLAGVEQIREEVSAYRTKLQTHIDTLDREIEQHLWVNSAFAPRASAVLDETSRTVDGLLERVEETRKGFENLPRQEDAVHDSFYKVERGRADDESRGGQ